MFSHSLPAPLLRVGSPSLRFRVRTVAQLAARLAASSSLLAERIGKRTPSTGWTLFGLIGPAQLNGKSKATCLIPWLTLLRWKRVATSSSPEVRMENCQEKRFGF